MKVKRFVLKGSIEDNLGIVQDILGKQLHEGVTDVGIRRIAEAIVKGVPARDYLGEIKAVTAWVRAKTRYTRDPYGAELIRHPKRMIADYFQTGQMALDCEESATLLASLLGSLGHNTRVLLIDSSPYTKDITHAIPQVEYNGKWIFLETTKNVPLGWHPEFSRMIEIE